MILRVVLRAAIALTLILASLPGGASRATGGAPQVHVFSCQVTSGMLTPLPNEVGLVVRFQNDSAAPLTSIVWRVRYIDHAIDFVDSGTFSPATRIDNYLLFAQGRMYFNSLGALGDVAAIFAHAPAAANHSLTKTDVTLPQYIGTEDPENCSIVRATSSTGETWLNPDLVQTLPSPTPSVDPTASPTPSSDITVSQPVDIKYCILQLLNKPFLAVKFSNDAGEPIDRVVVRAFYGNSGLDFNDVGTFARNTVVSHNLKRDLPDELRGRSYQTSGDPSDCAVVSVHFVDGTSWQNPSVAVAPPPLPTPVPDAIAIRGANLRWARPQSDASPTPTPTAEPSSFPSPGSGG